MLAKTPSEELKSVYNWQTPLYVSNTSAEPIYEVVVGLAHVQGTGRRSLEDFIKFQRDRLEQNQERLKQGGEPQPGDVYATKCPQLPSACSRREHGGSGFGSWVASPDGDDSVPRSSLSIGPV